MTNIPTDVEGFATWRKAQNFTTPKLAETAFLVERDLFNIAAMGDKVTAEILRNAFNYRANFAAMLAAS